MCCRKPDCAGRGNSATPPAGRGHASPGAPGTHATDTKLRTCKPQGRNSASRAQNLPTSSGHSTVLCSSLQPAVHGSHGVASCPTQAPSVVKNASVCAASQLHAPAMQPLEGATQGEGHTTHPNIATDTARPRLSSKSKTLNIFPKDFIFI